jgi:hypothetical protein
MGVELIVLPNFQELSQVHEPFVKESYVQCYIDYQNCYSLIDVELMKEVSNLGAVDAIKLVNAIDDLL